MSGIGASEIILILLIAFIVVGPQDLPKIARAFARALKRLRLIMNEVKRETGIDEIESEVKDIKREVRQTQKALDIREDLKQTEKEINADLKAAEKDVKSAAAEIGSEIRSAEKETKETMTTKEAEA